MKNIQKPFRIFLDTSVLLSGLNSPIGASGFIISLFKLKKIKIIISEEVITESETAIEKKFPLLKTAFFDFLANKPEVTKKITSEEIKSAYKVINYSDAPILAGAIKARADFLITLDKDFRKLAEGKVNFAILYPGEFLQKYRNR